MKYIIKGKYQFGFLRISFNNHSLDAPVIPAVMIVRPFVTVARHGITVYSAHMDNGRCLSIRGVRDIGLYYVYLKR